MKAEFTLNSVREGKLLFHVEPKPSTPDPTFDQRIEGILAWVAERVPHLRLPYGHQFTCNDVEYTITITNGWRDDPNEYATIDEISEETDEDDEELNGIGEDDDDGDEDDDEDEDD